MIILFPLTGGLETVVNEQMVRIFPTFRSKRNGVPLEVVYNLRTDVLENYSSIWLST